MPNPPALSLLSHRVRRLGLALLVTSLAACGGGGDPVAPPPPVAVSVSPTSATVNAGATQAFTATVTNTTNTSVTWTSSGGTLSGSGATVTWTAPVTGGSYTVTATSAADPTKNASATITVNAVGVAVSPATITVAAGGTQPFAATVTNSANTNVTWTSSGGTINGTGASVTWTAPTVGGAYTVTATSAADPTKTATAAVTVTPVQVVVTPGTQTVWRGEPVSLTAAVTGGVDTGVSWTTSCGAVSGTGLTVTYTAPNVVGPCTVTARSTQDNTKSAAATVTVRPAWRVAALDDADDGACTFAHCSLREALAVANAESNVDTIRVVNTTAGTITLGSALPAISNPVHLVGPGIALLTLNANGSVANPRRAFQFAGDFVASVTGLTVRGGVATTGGAMQIVNSANVSLTDVRLVGNESRDGDAGALFFTNQSRGQLLRVVIDSNRTVGVTSPGGGLSVTDRAQVTMSRGAIRNNTVSDGWGGGIRVLSAILTLDTVEVSGNRVLAGAGLGGGVLAEGATSSLTLRGTTVTQNLAPAEGGGLSLIGGVAASIVNSAITENTSGLGGGMVLGNVPTFTMTGTTVRANVARTRGGGMFLYGTTVATIGSSILRANRADTSGGGGLYMQNTSIARLTATVVDSNQALGPASGVQGGGGLWAGTGTQLEVTGGSITHNVTQQGWGAALFTFGNAVTLTDVVARNNRAGGAGGAYALLDQATVTVAGGSIRDNTAVVGAGGGVVMRSATATFTNTEFTGNVCELRGGGLQGFGGTVLTLANVTVTNNECKQDGGGIGLFEQAALTMTGGVVDNNRSTLATGGGMSRSSTGALTITGTRFTNNRAQTQGGGLQLVGATPSTLRSVTVSGNTAVTSSGGGMTIGGTGALIENSTISGNTSGGTGGAIFSSSTANSTVRNSTLSGNTGVIGGGIGATGTATLQNVTIVANTASTFGGGIGSNNATGNVTAVNVLLSGNRQGTAAQNCGTGSGGLITSTGGNLSDDATCATFVQGTDKANTAAGVSATLANNGGTTFTHALQTGSAAINAAVPASCPATDQRGFARQGACDIGAFEFGGIAPSASARAGMTKGVRPPVSRATPPRILPASTSAGRRTAPSAPQMPAHPDVRGGGVMLTPQIVR